MKISWSRRALLAFGTCALPGVRAAMAGMVHSSPPLNDVGYKKGDRTLVSDAASVTSSKHENQRTARPVTRVDTHAHIMRQDAPLAAERHSAPHRDATVEEFLTVLDQHEISHGVLIQPSFYGADNSLLLEALAAHPDRLRGTAIVEPTIDEKALAAMRAQGMRGIRLNWFHRQTLPDLKTYTGLFGRLRDVGFHVELYVEGAKLSHLLPTIQDSGVNLVLDHFGSPEPAEGVDGAGFRAVLQAVEGGRCWVKLSGPYRLGGASPTPYAAALLRAGGPERLLWGSDWPWVSYEVGRDYGRLLAMLNDWVPDAKDRETILSRTPAALFGF